MINPKALTDILLPFAVPDIVSISFEKLVNNEILAFLIKVSSLSSSSKSLSLPLELSTYQSSSKPYRLVLSFLEKRNAL